MELIRYLSELQGWKANNLELITPPPQFIMYTPADETRSGRARQHIPPDVTMGWFWNGARLSCGHMMSKSASAPRSRQRYAAVPRFHLFQLMNLSSARNPELSGGGASGAPERAPERPRTSAGRRAGMHRGMRRIRSAPGRLRWCLEHRRSEQLSLLNHVGNVGMFSFTPQRKTGLLRRDYRASKSSFI